MTDPVSPAPDDAADEWLSCDAVCNPGIWAISATLVLLPCGLPAGHEGSHRFEIEWYEPELVGGALGAEK